MRKVGVAVRAMTFVLAVGWPAAAVEGPGEAAAPAESPAGSPDLSGPAPEQTINDNLYLQLPAPTLGLYSTSGPGEAFHWNFNGRVLTLSQRPYPGKPDMQFWHQSLGLGYGAYIRGPLLIGPDGNSSGPASSFTQLQVSAANANAELRGFPNANLAILGSDQTRLEIRNFGSQVVGRNLLRLTNNGPSTFRFENEATGATFGFGSLNNGSFFIGATPGQPLAFTLTPSGDVTITGVLAQGSDRNTKRDIEDVDAEELLARLLELPLSRWSYKADAQGARHIGPMAQDFSAVFGLGADDTHLAPADVAGVGLAAAQALKRQLDARSERLRALEERLAALEARLEGSSE